MNRKSLLITVLALVGVLGSVGCCKKEKEQILALQQQYNDVQQAKQDLQARLAEAQDGNTQLATQVDARNVEIATLQAELKDAKTAPKPGPKTETDVPPGWQATATGAKITLGSDILFAPGRATLSSSGTAKLRDIAATIKSAYPGAVVRVHGFTDSDPISKSAKLWQDNLDLSANRAMAVTRQLAALGISKDRIETVAMGDTNFVAANTTADGKAKNRRVEIAVVK